ncbi:MAG: ATP-dependent DNA helicase [Candidatus Korobacteraceae bacterium]
MPEPTQSGSSTANPVELSRLSLYQFFGPGGLLSQRHPAYEFRKGQLAMASAVEEVIEEKRHLIVEAGTGTGKTLAYLLPIIKSGKRVIVSTGTKNLQEQLFFKDVPFLERALFGEPAAHSPRLKVCYMKGRQNYLCRKKLYELTDQPILNGLDEVNEFRTLLDWDKQTGTGDRAELTTLPETSPLWGKLNASAEHCIGSKCSEFERCFITEMRRKAAESDIIIVNHHLFFADLSVKLAAEKAPDAGVLPSAACVIFDEAHELEDVATSYFGISVSNLKVEDLLRDLEITIREKKVVSTDLIQLSARIRERSQFFFSSLPEGPASSPGAASAAGYRSAKPRPATEGRFAFDNRDEFLEEFGSEFIGLKNVIRQLHSELQAIPSKPDEVHNLIRRTDELHAQLSFLMESREKNTVYWIERRGGRGRFAKNENVFLQATPIDVSAILRQSLFDRFDSIVLTSATLAVANAFDYIKARLGLDGARELIVPSHFDYESQAIFYVPPDMPDPRDASFTAQATMRIRQLLEITRGRAFCLFTSLAQMQQVHDALLGQLPYPMLLQGSAPKTALIEQFRNTPNAVLFATASFWQGVDVQGEQLSAVIIDKIPFAVPSDPIVQARSRAIDEDGGNSFFDYSVPAAVITLKQGFGRLIRSLNDRGLLVLLDNRILKMRYGKVFIQSLPPYTRTTDIRKVEEFFGCSHEE